MGTQAMIEFKNVSKKFGKITAVNDLTLNIGPGKVLGLVGANGAGKSTMLRMAIGLYLPSEGSCKTLGTDVDRLGAEQLSRIGYVHQRGKLLDWMTVEGMLKYLAAYYKTWDTDFERDFIERFEIPLDRRVGKLSPGKYQQLAILAATAFSPDLLILDEPASELDPIARANFFDLLIEMISAKEHTIIISSHILSDIEKVINHLIVLDEGRLVRDIDFDSLREEFVYARFSGAGLVRDKIESFGGVRCCDVGGDEALVVFQNKSHNSIIEFAQSLQWKVELTMMNLEEIYKLLVA